ncbi:MAG: sulfatase [Polyangiaceae bacterium]
MRITATEPPARSRFGASILGGFVVAACVDAIVVSRAGRPRAPNLATAILEGLYAAGHLVALGVVVGGLAAVTALGAHRVRPRARPIIGAGVAFAAGVGAARVLLAVDLAVFPVPLRFACFAAAGAPAALLVALRGVAPRSPIAPALLTIASVGAIVAHPLLLDESYAGIHVFTNALAGLTLGCAIERVARFPRRAPTRRGDSEVLSTTPGSGERGMPERAEGARLRRDPVRGTRRVARPLPSTLAPVAVLVASVGAAISVAGPPSNAVRVALARRPSASLMPFLPHLRAPGAASTRDAVARQEGPWFSDRSAAPPIPPTRPPLLSSPPFVILLTIDAMRADVFDGDTPALTHLRGIAERGARFTMARSPASATSPAIGALLTGKYYSSLYWTERSVGGKLKFFLPDDKNDRLAELLERRGVATKLANTGRGFLPEYGLTRGMTVVSAPVKWAEDAMRVIEPWVDELADRGVDGGAFVFGHLMDAHAPYDKTGKRGTNKERYLEELATVDTVLGRLEDAISAHGLWDRTFLIVSADHGEAFGEHGTQYHGSSIYEELVRVPLVVRGPGVVPRAIDEPVSLIDLGPTVLDLFQIDTPATFMGQSLVPLLAGGDEPLTRPIVLDTGRRIQGLVGRDGLKVIRNVRAGTLEAYDLRADPGETQNLFGRPDLAPAFARLGAFFAQHELVRPGYEIPFRD